MTAADAYAPDTFQQACKKQQLHELKCICCGLCAMLFPLQVLWLADNYISSLSGISALQQLQQLNLARNDIGSIGSSLLSHTALTSLNLADNKISNFQVSRCF